MVRSPYGLLNEPEFIVSVAEYLQQRDISEFNPGQRPPMNQAKMALVEFSQSGEDAICKALVERWPVDLITSTELEGKLPAFSSLTKTTTRYAMDRAGMQPTIQVQDTKKQSGRSLVESGKHSRNLRSHNHARA